MLKIFLRSGIISFLFIFSNIRADVSGDTLTYNQKFILAVHDYEAGRYHLAEKKFHSILTDVMDYNDPSAQMMWIKSLYHVKKYRQAMDGAKSYLTLFPGSPYQKAMIQIMGDIHAKNWRFSEAFESYLKARSYASIPETYEIDKRLIQCIANGIKSELVESLLFRERRKPVRSILNLARAYDSFKRGDRYDTRISLDVVQLDQLPTEFHQLYFQLETFHTLGKPTKLVGVVLPLSGENSFEGTSYLSGLINAFNQEDQWTNISLLILDNESKCTKTVHHLRHLKNMQNIVGILGPISDLNAQCAGASMENGIPLLIPISTVPKLSSMSLGIFQLSSDLEHRGRSMAHYLVDNLGYARIAVLAPKDNLPIWHETEYFIDELFQMGIEPVSVQTYTGIPENISVQFKSIRKKAWSLFEEKPNEHEEPVMEIDSLDALFDVDVSDFFDMPDEEPEETMSRNDSSKVILETIDAIYTPIKENHLKFIGTQFPIYNLKSTVIGNNNWIHPELHKESIGPHLKGMLIYANSFDIDGWDDLNENNNINQLMVNYGEDHGQFLKQMGGLMGAGRKALMEKMKKMSPYQGENIGITFGRGNRHSNSYFHILKYIDDDLVPQNSVETK